MTKTTEEVVLAYKKENNPNKKVKILAICHLLRNEKTITEVSKILFKAYNTIKNWWQAFKKDGIRGLETKKIPGRPPKIKNKTLLEFMETKTKEEQYIVPENIARDLKNEFGVDYSLSGMRNAMHRLNYTCKTMEPLHSNMQSVEDVLEWQQDMKRWFSRLKKQNRCLAQRHHHTPTRYRPQVRPVGTGGTTRIWHLSWEPHKSIHKRGSLIIRQALPYCYKYTCHSCGNRFFYRPAQVARQDCRHFGSSVVEQVCQNETVSCR